jgi:hypothetical protein
MKGLHLFQFVFINPEFIKTFFHMDYSSGLYAAGKAGEKRGLETTARKLKAYGDPVEKIAEVTGLSPEDIEKL